MPLSRNLGTLTSWNPLGTSGPVTGLLYLFLTPNCLRSLPPIFFSPSRAQKVLCLVRKSKFRPKRGQEGPNGSGGNNSTLSLTSALDGVGGQIHAPAALPQGQEAGTHCAGGWVGPSATLDGGQKISPAYRDSIPGPSSP